MQLLIPFDNIFFFHEKSLSIFKSLFPFEQIIPIQSSMVGNRRHFTSMLSTAIFLLTVVFLVFGILGFLRWATFSSSLEYWGFGGMELLGPKLAYIFFICLHCIFMVEVKSYKYMTSKSLFYRKMSFISKLARILLNILQTCYLIHCWIKLFS